MFIRVNLVTILTFRTLLKRIKDVQTIWSVSARLWQMCSPWLYDKLIQN